MTLLAKVNSNDNQGNEQSGDNGGIDDTNTNTNTNTNTDVPELLKDYVLGKAVDGVRPGKEYNNLTTYNHKFCTQSDSITDSNDLPVYLNEMYGDRVEREESFDGVEQPLYVYIRYHDVAYKIVIKYEDWYETTNSGVQNVIKYTTTNVVKVYEPVANSRVGQVVQYKAKTTDETATDWLVLYDNGTTLDIMSLTTMGLCNLYDDPNATEVSDSSQGNYNSDYNNDYDPSYNYYASADAYDNAVSRLNTYCESLITNQTAQKVRSVGTQFDISDIPAGYIGQMKIGDMNAEQDVVRMSYYSTGGTGANYTVLGYTRANSGYWIASRMIEGMEGSVSGTYLGVRLVNQGACSCAIRLYYSNGQFYAAGSEADYVNGLAVRPVVRVSANDV